MILQGDRTLFTLDNQEQVNEVLEIIRGRKASLISITHQKNSLEDLFMREVQQRTEEHVVR